MNTEENFINKFKTNCSQIFTLVLDLNLGPNQLRFTYNQLDYIIQARELSEKRGVLVNKIGMELTIFIDLKEIYRNRFPLVTSQESIINTLVSEVINKNQEIKEKKLKQQEEDNRKNRLYQTVNAVKNRKNNERLFEQRQEVLSIYFLRLKEDQLQRIMTILNEETDK